MPKSKTVDGVEVNYDSYDDDDHEDEEIDESLLLDPEEFLLVDRHDRAIIVPYTTIEFQPQNRATKAINHAIQSKYQCPYKNWSEVKADKAGWNQFWNGFREKVTWHKDKTEEVKEVFNKKAARRLSSLLHDIKDGLKEQEVARLTTIFTEEYDTEQNSLPVHVQDSPAIRQMKISHAFVKYAGGKHRGRTFATGSTTSFYQRAPSGIRDIGDTSYSSHMSQGRSRAPQETPTKQEARLRAQIREEVRNEVREEREQALEQQVEQLFQAHWNAANPTQGATQRSSTSQNDNARPSPSSQPPPSNHRNHPSTSQGFPNQSGRGSSGGRRVILPALTINEGGRGRSTTTRAAKNVSRGRGGRGGIGRGKEILVDPEPEENSE
ncbi:hypothetical protein P8452_17208 [Trifolium repens]|nr:hypothetical protein P8452_17208 [Trifolium repens]